MVGSTEPTKGPGTLSEAQKNIFHGRIVILRAIWIFGRIAKDGARVRVHRGVYGASFYEKWEATEQRL